MYDIVQYSRFHCAIPQHTEMNAWGDPQVNQPLHIFFGSRAFDQVYTKSLNHFLAASLGVGRKGRKEMGVVALVPTA